MEHRLDVHREGAAQALGIDLFQLLHRFSLIGGVVDEQINPAEFAGGSLDDAPAVRLLGKVAGNQHRTPPGGLDQLLGLARILVLVPVRDEDVGAFAREREGDRAADAAVGAGDDSRLVFQSAEALVGRLAVVGARLHGLLRAGRLLLLLGERRSGSLLLRVCHGRNVRTVAARRIRRSGGWGKGSHSDVSCCPGGANLTVAPARRC